MRRSRVIVFAVIALAFSAFAGACGLDEGGVVVGESPDGSIATDGATIDGQIIDGQTSDSPIAIDGGSNDSATGPDGAATPDAGTTTFACGFTQVANCATDCPLAPHNCPLNNICISSCYPGCLGYTFQCDACGTDGGTVALSRCEPEDASAYAECLSGLTRCACPGNTSSQCPGNNQTCESKECFECAEPDAGATQIGHSCAKMPPNNTCESSGACN